MRSIVQGVVSRLSVGAVVLLALAGAGTAPGDTVKLHTGGVLEGELLDAPAGHVRIRTPVGAFTFTDDQVVSIERGRSVFDDYRERLASIDGAPQEHFELSEWCRENGLAGERRAHLLRAIELDPDFADARAALGYVRVGDVWVEGRTRAEREPPPVAAQADADRLAAAAQSQWYRQIRAIRDGMLNATIPRIVAEGERRIREIDDPAAIVPLCELLSEGSRAARAALVEALTRFQQDEATLNLAVFALVDRDAELRRRAVLELARRGDSRVIAHMRKALTTGNDALVRRSAVALAMLNAQAAVPDLISQLTAERRRLVEVPVNRYFYDWRTRSAARRCRPCRVSASPSRATSSSSRTSCACGT
jgi:hypothetical protein